MPATGARSSAPAPAHPITAQPDHRATFAAQLTLGTWAGWGTEHRFCTSWVNALRAEHHLLADHVSKLEGSQKKQISGVGFCKLPESQSTNKHGSIELHTAASLGF